MIDIENHIIEENSELSIDMKFKDAFKAYVDHQIKEYENNDSKKPFYSNGADAFSNNWLKPIHEKPLNKIMPKDITALKSRMIDKSMRYKLSIHQWVNPVYVFVNDNIDGYVKSPAKIKKADRNFNDTRELNLSNEEIKTLFQRLRDYPISPYREVFMWLMHGRRRGEVLSLQWDDIDLKNNTYMIRAVNNKARVNMTYKLTNRLRDTLKIQAGVNTIEDMKGYVFRGVRDNTKPLHELRMRKHWLELEEPIVMHQLRACIVTYLKNVHNVSNEMSGYILGHIQSSTVTERYGTYGYETLSDNLNLMLDNVFDDVRPIDNKLQQLQTLFPNKTKEQLEVFLND